MDTVGGAGGGGRGNTKGICDNLKTAPRNNKKLAYRNFPRVIFRFSVFGLRLV